MKATRSISQFSEENGGPQSLLPMFKDDDDAEFAKELFRNTLIHGGEYRIQYTVYELPAL